MVYDPGKKKKPNGFWCLKPHCCTFPPKKLEFKGCDDVRELMNGADGTGVVSPENEMLTYLRSVARPSRAQHFERNYIRRNCLQKKKKSLFPSALWKSGDSSEPCAH